MSRQRFIYPDTFLSEDFISLSIGARLLWIGLFTTADDYGRGRASPKAIKAAIYPADTVTEAEVSEWLSEIRDRGMIRTYTVRNSAYYDIPTWALYQKPRWKAAPKIPEFPGKSKTPGGPPADPRRTPGGPPAREGKGRVGEGKGRVGSSTHANQVAIAKRLRAQDETEGKPERPWNEYTGEAAALLGLRA